MSRQERPPRRLKRKPGSEFATAIFPQPRNGESVPCAIIANSQRAKDALVRKMEESGIVFEKPTEQSRAVFGFGGVNWDNCGWNPQGPKPNWTTSSNPIKN